MSRELAALQQENPAFARSGRGATPSKKRAKKEIDYNIKEEKEENTEGDSGAVTEVASENGDASYEDVQQEEHPEQPRVERTDSANIDEPAAQYASFNDKAEGFGGARKIHGLPNLGTSHSSGAFTAPATPHNASFPFNQNGCGAPILMPSVLGAASSYHDLPHNGFSYSQPHAFNNSYSMPNTPITNNFSPWMNGGHGSMAHGNDFGDIQFDGHNSATGTPVSHGALHHSMNAAFGHSQAPLIRPSPVRPYLMHHANTDYTGVDAFKMLPPPISTNARRRNQSFDFGETFLSPDSSPITKVDSQHSSQPSIDTTTSFLSDMDMNMDPHAHLETPSPMNQAPPTGPGFPSFGGAHFPNKGDQDDEDMNIESFY